MRAPPRRSSMKKLFDLVELRLKSMQLDWSSIGMSEHSAEVSQNDIYIARQGKTTHGIRFATDALQRGAVLIICEDSADARQYVDDQLASYFDRIVFSDDFDQSVKALADRVYGKAVKNVSLVGITGTNGKTSTAFISVAMLSLQGIKAGLIGTSGYGVYGDELKSTRNTTPDYLSIRRYISELVNHGCQCVVMEVSSHAIALERVAGLEFDVKVFTNFSRDHLDFHGSLEQYREVKESFILARGTGKLVINTDDPVGFGMCDGLRNSKNIRGYGFNNPPKCISAYMKCVSAKHVAAGGQSVTVEYAGSHLDFQSGLSGKFNVYNFMAALLVCDALGLDNRLLIESPERIKPIAGRAQHVPETSRAQVYIDYAHTPDGISSVLQDLTGMDENSGDVWCLFGCGGDRDRGKRAAMGRIAVELSDHVVICDDNVRSEVPEKILVDIINGIEQKAGMVVCRDREQAINYIASQANEDDLVFILGKGSESFIDYGNKKLPMNDMDTASRYFS
ncbi:MAG: UDP-N-acetylmuramoyl-L-alanyl-D-glutamate--2,6-diaminopimelate ligase [Gammaproteobacteria bacterium]|nr:MAG: UDP-N-acetylmuramoyl-L-alanyl-D-glutamate--2,6-diaminopimelate ligase [Gammaproteobacteria bacterium]